MANPMEQFEVTPIVPLHLGNLDISFTNASLWMCIVAGATALFLTMGASSRRLVPTRMQSIAEISYVFIADMIRSAAGIEGLKFFPFVFTLFMFVLFSNIIGLFPLQLPFAARIVQARFQIRQTPCIGIVIGHADPRAVSAPCHFRQIARTVLKGARTLGVGPNRVKEDKSAITC